jgi:glutathione synthase/RimK-type ligase-like ATP-grasp enzyme
MLTLAIQPDHQLLMSGRYQSFSTRWIERAKASGFAARSVDVYAGSIRDQLEDCAGFMWWFAHLPELRHGATRIVEAIEHGLRIPTFPNRRTIWHFDDKVAQAYLLDAAGIPSPRTWIFWDVPAARVFAANAKFPMVLKLAGGIGSEHVRRVDSGAEAAFWIDQLFGAGVSSLAGWPRPHAIARAWKRVVRARAALAGRSFTAPSRRAGLQHGYVLFQEFVAGNAFDTRVTVIGERAFGFRRFNRPGDFRASGSGRIDWTPDGIDAAAVRLAFRVARALGTQSVAVDVLRRPDGTLVVNEISYYYEGWAVGDCPGHWTPEMVWRPGRVAPEDAIFDDFTGGRAPVAAAPSV